MSSLQLSPQEAAIELLKRRAARASYTEYCRYVAPDEQPAKHHEILCDALNDVSEGKLRRLMVFMPPGSAKSTYSTVRFGAYYLGKHGQNNVICGSYSGDLAESFGKKCRNLIDSQEHKNVFPDCILSADTTAKGEWEVKKGGGYKSCGVDGSITGRRADLGIIDDPVKGRKEADSETVKKAAWNWFKSDFLTRLKPGAAIVIIQTRWVEDDISGRILPSDWDGESGDFVGYDGQVWKVISIQAQAEEGKNDPLGRKEGEYLWLDWFTEEYWAETKAAMMSEDMRNWNALYQQRPTPDDGDFFRREWFRFYDTPPKHLNRYITHDDAVTEEDLDPDYTELADWGVDPDNNIYALNWWSGRTTSDIWTDELIDMIERAKPFATVGESGVIRRAVEPFLIKRMRDRKVYSRLEWLPTIGDKMARARAFQAMASMGKVYFPRTEWAEAVISQLCRFPAGSFDDKVDACGLIGRAINQTWAATTPPKVSKKPPIDEMPTIGQMVNKRMNKKPGRNRI